MGDPYPPCPELDLLRELELRTGERFAQGFELGEYGDTRQLGLWSEDPHFLTRFISFARANCSGSAYASWRLDHRVDVRDSPVVVFTDDGGIHAVAHNLLELFQLLGYDSEISTWPDSAYFNRKDGTHEPSEGHETYVAWLDKHFGLRPTDAPNSIVGAAQAEFGERLWTWVRPFLLDGHFTSWATLVTPAPISPN